MTLHDELTEVRSAVRRQIRRLYPAADLEQIGERILLRRMRAQGFCFDYGDVRIDWLFDDDRLRVIRPGQPDRVILFRTHIADDRAA